MNAHAILVKGNFQCPTHSRSTRASRPFGGGGVIQRNSDMFRFDQIWFRQKNRLWWIGFKCQVRQGETAIETCLMSGMNRERIGSILRRFSPIDRHVMTVPDSFAVRNFGWSPPLAQYANANAVSVRGKCHARRMVTFGQECNKYVVFKGL
jgi:hypothetical protein